MDIAVLLYTLRLSISPITVWAFRIWGLGCKDKKKAILCFVAFIIYLFMTSYFLISKMGFYPFSKIAAAIALVPSLIIIPLLSCDDLAKTFFMQFTSMNTVLVIMLLAAIPRGIFQLTLPVTIGIMLLLTIFTFILAIKYFVKPLRFLADNITGNWWIMTFNAVLVCFAVMIITTYAPIRFHNQSLFSGTIALILIATYFLMLYTNYQNLKNIQELSKEHLAQEFLKIQVYAMKKNIMVMQDAQHKEQILRHDRRHFAYTLIGLISNGDTKEALEMLHYNTTMLYPKKYCKNVTVNSIISYYANLAKQKEITFSCSLDIPEEINVDSLALSVTISNLLENAIHACQRQRCEEKPWIEINSYYKEQLLIEVKNTCYDQPVFDLENRPVSSKKAHGIGTKSIIAFTEKYHGSVFFEKKQDVFTVKIIL